MGLDIYVGPFTRYCSGDWETIVQRTAREQGIAFKTIRTNPDPVDKITDPVVIGQAVDGWRRSLEAGLKPHLPSGLFSSLVVQCTIQCQMFLFGKMLVLKLMP